MPVSYLFMVSDVVGIGSEYFVVYLSCVYICSADYVELPVILYLLQCFGISPVVQNEKKLWNFHIG